MSVGAAGVARDWAWATVQPFFDAVSDLSVPPLERIERFYSRHASKYDGSRAGLLHGRAEALKVAVDHLPDEPKPLVWVDFGAGTGWSLEAMSEIMPLTRFSRVYLLDVSQPMLDIAAERIRRLQAGDICELVCGDAADFDSLAKADLVTFSYSISRMPDYQKAVDKAVGMLAPGGLLAVVDFTVASSCDPDEARSRYWALPSWLLKTASSIGGLHMEAARRQYVERALHVVWEHFRLGAVPYWPIIRVPYYILICRKPQSTDAVECDGR
ncbi:unnamed protein product (mitochondrion) [Plasmodiophora brassicae]|uniref:Methyltransferase type 11 domain-containing protein n=1 Tax=Plasmodiophora brassicae TaxID=37360 RepID=A0A0G4J5J6_PLABS|nr:hypothetical protein PBRA_002586 [Plasmodiophora brassicae]SPQ94749.1 unnamed protein product [Plasmodiophora brassicae]